MSKSKYKAGDLVLCPPTNGTIGGFRVGKVVSTATMHPSPFVKYIDYPFGPNGWFNPQAGPGQLIKPVRTIVIPENPLNI
jgi:hypothetical protein